MERDNCTIECREEEVCKNSHNCHARVKVAQLLSGPESESKIGESLEKSSNKEKMLGLTIIKYALLGNAFHRKYFFISAFHPVFIVKCLFRNTHKIYF